MHRSLVSFVILLCLATPGMAGERPKGLLWNRSGLAATLPLQVRTDPEADYLVRLRDVETEQIVLAAYIRGGEFFRVLVPPGQYDVLFASGETWRGEDALFGPETQSFILDDPLSFGATVSRKHGHSIDLRAETGIAVRDFALCQRFALDFNSLLRPGIPAGKPRGGSRDPAGSPFGDPPYRAGQQHARPYPDRSRAPGLETPRYDLQSQVCD